MESTGYSLTDQSPAAEDSGYRYADPEQILRSHQRDTEHVDRLRELVTDVARNIRAAELVGEGSRWVVARGETLQVLAKLLYFGLTFASASQTLGEEYVEILPYAVKRSNFPSRLVRTSYSLSNHSSREPYSAE
ncbi:hypothetical protein QFC20_004507 [Naganishia adeliensis]|uniref:Uncharacterized protein n=1 Tax=Naganishia adeliensis TaxID=92952 RepID=A0ACC2W093_9TREE|nr:hypothetical protein QFC20_004507 [Naganishia adeliensis]